MDQPNSTICIKDLALATEILCELRDRVAAGGEGGLYGDKEMALREINAAIASPSQGSIGYLLLATGNLQELAMECGWGTEFNVLAARLERALGIT